MDPYTLRHYKRVARSMNNYVAASAYNFYFGYNRIPIEVYQPGFYGNANLGNHFADRLYSVGMPNGIVNLGYHIGELFNGNL